MSLLYSFWLRFWPPRLTFDEKVALQMVLFSHLRSHLSKARSGSLGEISDKALVDAEEWVSRQDYPKNFKTRVIRYLRHPDTRLRVKLKALNLLEISMGSQTFSYKGE